MGGRSEDGGQRSEVRGRPSTDLRLPTSDLCRCVTLPTGKALPAVATVRAGGELVAVRRRAADEREAHLDAKPRAFPPTACVPRPSAARGDPRAANAQQASLRALSLPRRPGPFLLEVRGQGSEIREEGNRKRAKSSFP